LLIRNSQGRKREICIAYSGRILAALRRKDSAWTHRPTFLKTLLDQSSQDERDCEITLSFLTQLILATPAQNGYTQFEERQQPDAEKVAA
jgi:hypothetical protein